MDSIQLYQQNDLLKNNLEILISKLKDEERIRFHNEIQRITFLINSNDKLTLEHRPMRIKRGLINGLGSIIKSISGNLDNNDLLDLERKLTHNEVLIKHHISLTTKALDSFHTILTNVTSQQNYMNVKLTHEVHTQSIELLLIELVFQAETVNDLFKQLNEGIVFAQHSIFHTSIMSQALVQRALRTIPESQRIDATMSQLMPLIRISIHFEPLSYILKIPVLNKRSFEYITTVPIIHSQNHHGSYPISQTLQVLKGEDVRLVQNCKKLNYFICEEQTLNVPSCERDLILHQDIKHCNFTTIFCPASYTQRISENAIYIYSDKPQQYTQKCASGLWTKTLENSVVLNIDECSYDINGMTLTQTIHTREKIAAPKFDLLKYSTEFTPIFLEGTSKELEKQLHALSTLNKQPKEKMLHTNTLTVNVFTTCGIIGIIFLVCYFIKRRNIPQREVVLTPTSIPLQQVTQYSVPVSV